ncbi:hypothetical protein ACHAWU_000335 [Discostella pseudostelligera]|uniref:Uncharacterized protein n=1 Tax=Discostella pseudostelligera TaxID=259834 RepID=A0ABD3M8F3_9STRA
MSEKVIELSIDETNALRISLGLKPLRTATTTTTANDGAPTKNFAASASATTIATASSIEVSSTTKNQSSLSSTANNKSSTTLSSNSNSNQPKFRSNHNIQHLLPAGSSTILTLGDTFLLGDPDQKNDDDDDDDDSARGAAARGQGGVYGEDEEAILLTNANMDEHARTLKNLKRKQKLQMGSGRAGGYAGYDDDEFDTYNDNAYGNGGYDEKNMVEEDGLLLGGGDGAGGGGRGEGGGFTIDADGKVSYINNNTNNADGGLGGFGGRNKGSSGGGAISLQSRHPNKIASDYLAHDDDEEMEDNNDKLEKERRKQIKLLEKLRRKTMKKEEKEKKKQSKRRRRADDSDDEEEEQDGGGDAGGSLLAMLDATAVGKVTNGEQRMRHENNVDKNEVNGDNTTMIIDKDKSTDATAPTTTTMEEDEIAMRRKRFDTIMEKGKARTDRAFNRTATATSQRSSSNAQLTDDDGADDDDDDAFLNAALAKARRLKRLKELTSGNSNNNGDGGAATVSGTGIVGENAVVAAVERSKRLEEEAAAAARGGGAGGDNSEGEGGGSKITFEFDEVREFTRALRAREDSSSRTKQQRGIIITTSKKKDIAEDADANAAATAKPDPSADTAMTEEDVDDNMHELAKGMNHDDEEEEEDVNDSEPAFGSTAVSAPVGRGMSNFLSLLRHTGEIKDHSTKEEMRGRAKDKRTYEDYEHLDLEKVVKVAGVHERDRELASREIKLEYRDEHGRLLTRKEAYRDMCYQFHGHGSSKKNQERRLRQIERERAEYSKSSGIGGSGGGGEGRGVGTLGALKATQKATGKAFIIHKT